MFCCAFNINGIDWLYTNTTTTALVFIFYPGKIGGSRAMCKNQIPVGVQNSLKKGMKVAKRSRNGN